MQPEPGVVVGAGDPDGYGAPPPVVYAPPAYMQPGYGWPQAYMYPPIGISLGLGYSRGHRGGGWHRGWR